MRNALASSTIDCSLLALSVSAMIVVGTGTPAASPTPDIAAILSGAGTFYSLPVVDAMPQAIIACCADADGRLAKPGEDWDATDVRGRRTMRPRQRVLWVAQSEQLTAVHYEQGGFAHSYAVALLRHAEGSGDGALVWQGYTRRFKDFEQFAQAQVGVTARSAGTLIQQASRAAGRQSARMRIHPGRPGTVASHPPSRDGSQQTTFCRQY